jgi:CRISP-associated protein Cas1
MKYLLLNGHGIDIRIDSAKLCIKNGFYSVDQAPEVFVYKPRQIDIDHIVVYGQDGNLTLDAVRWLSKHRVQLSVLNWNGELLTTITNPTGATIKTKLNQMKAYENKRIDISKAILKAKFQRTKEVLEYLKTRYPKIRIETDNIAKRMVEAKTISQIMQVEGHVAHSYWEQIKKIIPEKTEFSSRYSARNRTQGAGDQTNCLLNYGYALLEAECIRAIQANGLETTLGFLHEQRSGKQALAYDLQEPYRFLIDLTIINALENNIFNKKDFIRTENYNLRLRPEGAKKLVKQIELQFNSRAEYKGKQTTWHHIILEQVRELTNYINGTRKTIDFTQVKTDLERIDTEQIRQKILKMNYTQWKKQGYSKGTLHYMKQNAKKETTFKLNKHVIERLKD